MKKNDGFYFVCKVQSYQPPVPIILLFSFTNRFFLMKILLSILYLQLYILTVFRY